MKAQCFQVNWSFQTSIFQNDVLKNDGDGAGGGTQHIPALILTHRSHESTVLSGKLVLPGKYFSEQHSQK
jgi:hypothetical protein